MFSYTCTGVTIEYQIIKEYQDPNWNLAESSLNKRIGCFSPSVNKLYSSPYNYLISNYTKVYESNAECFEKENIVNIEKKLVASQSIPLVSGNDIVSYYFGCDTVINNNKKSKLQNKINLNENVKRFLKVNTYQEIVTYLSSSSSSDISSSSSSSFSSSSSSSIGSSSSSSSSLYNPFNTYEPISITGWSFKQPRGLTGFIDHSRSALNESSIDQNYGDVVLNDTGDLMFINAYLDRTSTYNIINGQTQLKYISYCDIYKRNQTNSQWSLTQKLLQNSGNYGPYGDNVDPYSIQNRKTNTCAINSNGSILFISNQYLDVTGAIQIPPLLNQFNGFIRTDSLNIYTGNANTPWSLHQKIIISDVSGGNVLNWRNGTYLEPSVENKIVNYPAFNVSTNSSGNIVLLTCPFCVRNNYTGIVLIYTGNINTNWQEHSFIPLTGNNFTTAKINDDGSIIALGRTDSPSQNPPSGSTIIYTGNLNDGWNLKQIINNSGNANITLSSNGNIILIGDSLWSSSGSPFCGAVKIYIGSKENGWGLKQILSGKNSYDSYGHCVAANNNASIIISAPYRSELYDGYQGSLPTGGLTPIVYTGSPFTTWNPVQNISTGWDTSPIWKTSGRFFLGGGSGYGPFFPLNSYGTYGFNVASNFSGNIISIGKAWEFYTKRITYSPYPNDYVDILMSQSAVLPFESVSDNFSGPLPNLITGKINIANLNKAFIPVIGGEDYRNTDPIGARFQNYFPLMGNAISGNTSNKNKYFDFKIGNCHFFVLDNDPVCGGVSGYSNGSISEGAGIGENNISTISNSTYEDTQRNWFNNAILNSSSKYKFVFAHRPSFASTSYHYSENGLGIPFFGGAPIYYKGNTKFNPFRQNSWYLHLADAVFCGNSRYYERINFDQFIAPYIQILRNNNTLEIRYGISGYSSGMGVVPPGTTTYMTHNPDYMTYESPASGKVGGMSIGIRTNNQSSFTNFNMTSSGSGFVYFYTIPSNTNNINLRFTNSSGRQDFNTYDFNEYGYIYYTNNISNNFSKTQYFIVGNGGFKLENSIVGYTYIGSCVPGSCPSFPYSKKAHQECGFTVTDIYNDGLVYTHYAYEDILSNQFTIQDQVAIGNTGTTKLLSFASIANWGNNSENDPYIQKVNFYQDDRGRGNNYFQSQIAKTIKNKNIPYVFGVGNYIYNLQQGLVFNTGYAYLRSSSPYLFLHSNTVPNLLDQNVGAFWFDYIPFYRGYYTGYSEVEYPFIYSSSFSGFTMFSSINIQSGLRDTCEFIKIEEPLPPTPQTASIWISVNQ